MIGLAQGLWRFSRTTRFRLAGHGKTESPDFAADTTEPSSDFIVVRPFVVSSWPAYYLTRAGTTDLQEDEVLLLDPTQVWLELHGRLDSSALIAPCGALDFADGVLSWDGGCAPIAQLIDLDPLLGRTSESEIVGIDAARRLNLPVLADYDAACEQWSARQYLPLGDERLLVRKIPRAQHLIGQQSTFETLLNGLTAA